MLSVIISIVIGLAAQAGQSAIQWLQSPSGQNFLCSLGQHLGKEVYKYFKEQK